MQIKLVSLNIFNGHALDAAVEFLTAEKPDVVVLQEVHDGADPKLEPKYRTLEELTNRLGLPYHDFEPCLLVNRAEGKIPWGNATFSRFPITGREAIFFNGPFKEDYVEDKTGANNLNMPHVLLGAKLETPAGEVNVYNLHGTWDLDGDNFSEKRRQMSEAVITAAKGKSNFIVAGDTNAKPTNQAMVNIEDHLVSVFGHELTSTFNMSRKDNPGYATAAVDMVYVSADIRVLAKSCPNVDVSDHLPLVVTLEIAPVKPASEPEKERSAAL